jgi:hypothetical protein
VSDDRRIEALARRLETSLRSETVMIHGKRPTHAEVREHQRRCVLTLSDGTIWRYYNDSNYWESQSGALVGRFSERPCRADRAPLTPEDLDGIRRLKHFAVTHAALDPRPEDSR